MYAESQSIGIMEGAFFVPKGDLLFWVNELLKINLTKIQQLGTGAVYCQILDVMHPGKIALNRVNFRASNQWQFINNLKILQLGFSKCKILKYIDIQKLSKSRYQDNLQFIQWMKRYFDLHNKTDLSTYDPQVSRKNVQIDFSFVQIRNPLRKQLVPILRADKQQALLRGKSRSPYANVKSKVNSRSITLGKPLKNSSNFYLNKLNQIRKIINNKNSQDKLANIKEIIGQIEQELPNDEEDQGELHQTKELYNVPSKKIITPPTKKKSKTVVK